jgi:hypothetical protein
LAWISRTLRSARYRVSSSSPVFTGDLRAFQNPLCRLAGPLRHAHVSHVPGLLRDLRPISQSTVGNEPAHLRPGWPEDRATRDGSHVHPGIDRPGRRPSFVPAASPRLRRSPSPWPPHRHNQPASELTSPRGTGHALHTSPYPPDLSRPHADGTSTTGSLSLHLLVFACRTRTVWQCRSIPSLSGPLATIPGVPRIRLPPASLGPLRRTDGEGLPPPLDYLAPRGAQSSRATHA